MINAGLLFNNICCRQIKEERIIDVNLVTFHFPLQDLRATAGRTLP